MYFVLCSVYCVLFTVYCVLCTVYCVLCTVYRLIYNSVLQILLQVKFSSLFAKNYNCCIVYNNYYYYFIFRLIESDAKSLNSLSNQGSSTSAQAGVHTPPSGLDNKKTSIRIIRKMSYFYSRVALL